MDGQRLAKVISKSIFLASIQSSIGSVEMSSKFSVMNFSKDAETLQRAADALRSYIIIAVIWTLGTMLSLYSTDGMIGLLIGLAANLVMIAWIVLSYMHAFKDAAKNYNIQEPKIFPDTNRAVMIFVGIIFGFVLSLKFIGYF